ncbi:MAG: hypothetical protein JJ902_11685 [Roseibium sp.]|nr:hypothetical protein [Roseibium sp.]
MDESVDILKVFAVAAARVCVVVALAANAHGNQLKSRNLGFGDWSNDRRRSLFLRQAGELHMG